MPVARGMADNGRGLDLRVRDRALLFGRPPMSSVPASAVSRL